MSNQGVSAPAEPYMSRNCIYTKYMYCVSFNGNVTPTIISTIHQKLPFGSGDYPNKLLFHQALN